MSKYARKNGYRLQDFSAIVIRARKRFHLSDAAIARILDQEFGFRVSPQAIGQFRSKEGLA